MREFTCIVCGTKGSDTSPQGAKMFCSRKCTDIHRAAVRAESFIPCKFNEGVMCDRMKCKSCGWNPDVAKRRKDELYERQFQIER